MTTRSGRSRGSHNYNSTGDDSSGSDPNRSRHRSRSRSRRRNDPPPAILDLPVDSVINVATATGTPTRKQNKKSSRRRKSSASGNTSGAVLLSASSATTARDENSPFHVTGRQLNMGDALSVAEYSRGEQSNSAASLISVEMMEMNLPPDEDDDNNEVDSTFTYSDDGTSQRRGDQKEEASVNAPTSLKQIMQQQHQKRPPPQSNQSNNNDNSPPRSPQSKQRPSLGPKQSSTRKARDRDDFRTSFVNPYTTELLGNNDPGSDFWGVSTRWFSDANEFVGELAGMATRRASTDQSHSSMITIDHHEIGCAEDDQSYSSDEDEDEEQNNGGHNNRKNNNDEDVALSFSDNDDTPLFDELSSLGDTQTGIFTDITRRQAIRGAWTISISFIMVWIAVQVALQHSSTGREWHNIINSHQITFAPRRSKRFNAIKSHLIEISGEEAFMNEDSPQHRALVFVADGDTLVLDPNDEHVRPQLLQRYALAVFYFSTGGTEWKSRTYWLTGRHECGWLFVICSDIGIDENGNNITFTAAEDDDYSNMLDSELVLEEGKTVTGLSLYGQDLRGYIPREIALLEHLRVLDLGNNYMRGYLIAEFGRLQQLRKLYLENNQFEGGIEAMVWLTSLKHLSLENNELTGTISFDLGKLKQLEEVRIGQNKLHGHIPSSLFSSETLMKLDLHENDFTGVLDIHKKSILEYLYLHGNQMSGQLQPSSLCNVSDTLIDLRLNNNSFAGKIPTLDCNMERLELMSLAENDLTGPIPSMMGNKLPSLREIHLYENGLISTIPDSIFRPENLTAVLLGNNALTGELTAGMVNDAHNLAHLYVNSNRMSGNLDDFAQAKNLDSLQKLRLEYNAFSGTIPQFNMLETIELLYLYNNSLVGTLDNLGGGVNLRKLKVSNNTLDGPIASNLGELKNLKVLSLNGNKFKGTLPSQLQKLTELEELRFEHNDISGIVPQGICELRKSSLGSLVSDCAGKPPEVTCSCCTECIL